MTTERDFSKELCYGEYWNNEGNSIEYIDYQCLFGVITELVDRIEKLEQRLEETEPSMNDVFGPTGLIGDPQ